jgi:1-acyl-sn-glycerol-3-phosphate acyltransferase
LAIDHGHPILPMAVHGTSECLKTKDWRMGRARAEVRVLEPIETAGMTREDLPALRDRVRELISDTRDQLRIEHGDVAAPSEAS